MSWKNPTSDEELERKKASRIAAQKRYRLTPKSKLRDQRHNQNPETKRKASVRAKRYWADPEIRKKRQIRYRRWHQSPAGKEWSRRKEARRRLQKRGVNLSESKLVADWEYIWKKRKKVRCYWCGKQFKPKQCSTDHIIALINGGKHSLTNVCISCNSCNFRKNKRSLNEWNKSLIDPALL